MRRGWILAGIVAGVVIYRIINSTVISSPKDLKVVYTDQILDEEQAYKYKCKPIMNSDIKNAEDSEEYKDEFISFVGKVDIVEESDNLYTYYINDINLSDGGGIWQTVSTNKFNIGDMVIVYGSNAIKIDEIVSIDAKYMEIYRQ